MLTKEKAIKAINEGKEVYYRHPFTTKFIRADSNISYLDKSLEYVLGPLVIDLGIK